MVKATVGDGPQRGRGRPAGKSLQFGGCESDAFHHGCARSSSPEPKDQRPSGSLKNGGVSCAVELKQPVGSHCHGPGAVGREDGGDKQMAKKKLYIASGVCLVFMIGEVIGRSPASLLVRTFDKGPLQLLGL